jgi:mannitol 2-dehydrogenase
VVTSHALNERSLAHHSARVSVPNYDRRALGRGVVHISVGAFHRSHQAVYFDDLARRGLADGWAVTGVGLHHPGLKEALDPQDGLYTVVTRGAGGDAARVVGVITRYLYAPLDRRAVVEALADARTRLVTLTITAAGYKVDAKTGGFDEADPAVVHDLAHPADPCSALGFLVEGLERRRRSGLSPFTVLSCDNMTGNGKVARAAVTGMAALRDPSLAQWVDQRGAFPDSMVDRITPGTTDEDRAMVERIFGVRDRWPVMTEPFSQWVIEDSFCDGRPPLDEVGVQFVDDVSPYALTKTRLLNATHTALGHLGLLAGHSRLDITMADPAFAAYVECMMNDEIAPLLPDVGIDLPAYTANLRERFANARIADPLTRLCRNGSTKVKSHLLPSIAEARALGRPHGLLTLAVAAWCRYLGVVGDRGCGMLLEDPRGEVLRVLAQAGACPRYVDEVRRDLRELERDGPRAVISRRMMSVSSGAVS